MQHATGLSGTETGPKGPRTNGGHMTDEQEVLATLKASPGRRMLGMGSLWMLAILLIYVAFATPPSLVWQGFLLVMGAGSAWMADRMRRATAMQLDLTRDGLFDSSGACLCRVEEVEKVERGMFAFKPSNGFLVKLQRKEANVWRPGLWWRVGRRLGVGGMTSAAQGKAMADILATMAFERTGADQ